MNIPKLKDELDVLVAERDLVRQAERELTKKIKEIRIQIYPKKKDLDLRLKNEIEKNLKAIDSFYDYLNGMSFAKIGAKYNRSYGTGERYAKCGYRIARGWVWEKDPKMTEEEKEKLFEFFDCDFKEMREKKIMFLGFIDDIKDYKINKINDREKEYATEKARRKAGNYF